MGAALIPLSEVLNQLTKVFKEEGYDSATLSRLSSATGLGKASLYHYFPGGKVDMAIAVAKRSNELFHQMVIAPLESGGDAVHRIEQMINNIDTYYSKGEDSCLLGMLAMGGSSDLFRQHVRHGLGQWVEALAQTLVEAGHSPSVAHQRAEDTVFRVEGALLVVRGIGDPGPFSRMLAQLKDQLLA